MGINNLCMSKVLKLVIVFDYKIRWKNNEIITVNKKALALSLEFTENLLRTIFYLWVG
jgi:hypothetical protein